MNPGYELTPVVKKVTQEKINKYAQASGDFNPLHLDEDFAKTTMFKGTIAHGLLSVAYLSELMTSFWGDSWIDGGDLEVTFLRPVRPGDIVTAGGRVTESVPMESGKNIVCAVFCKNQNGETVIKGTASCFISK